MARKKFVTFIDEVKPTSPFYYYNYTAVILEQNEYIRFTIEFDKIKERCIKRLGGDKLNLHYYELTRKKGDFRRITLQEEQCLWHELFVLFNNTRFNIISGVVDNTRYTKLCQQYKIELECIAFRLLMQNIVRFQYIENGFTDITIESSNDERKLLEEYFRQKLQGVNLLLQKRLNYILIIFYLSLKLNYVQGYN